MTVTGVRVRRWLLPLALVLAVVGMHHIPSAPPPDPAPHVVAMESPGDGDPGHDDSGHDSLHPCLAVLSAAAGVPLAPLLTPATSGPPTSSTRRPGVRTRRRRAPPAGRALLTAVCVWRT